MMEVRALASNQPVSPRKVRLVLAAIRGRSVDEALGMLEFMPQRSARANAENNHNLNPDRLVVKRALADDGRMLKRFRARSRGRVSPLLRRHSHIEIVVEGDEGF